jgi:hypothetical protein
MFRPSSGYKTLLEIAYLYTSYSVLQPDEGRYRRAKHVVHLARYLGYYTFSCVSTAFYFILRYFVSHLKVRGLPKDPVIRRLGPTTDCARPLLHKVSV